MSFWTNKIGKMEKLLVKCVPWVCYYQGLSFYILDFRFFIHFFVFWIACQSHIKTTEHNTTYQLSYKYKKN